MEQITITKTATTTVLSIVDGSVTRKIAVTKAENFKTDDGLKKIVFPENETLNQLNLTAGKLSSATQTALSLTTSSTAIEVFDALVTGGFFEGK